MHNIACKNDLVATFIVNKENRIIDYNSLVKNLFSRKLKNAIKDENIYNILLNCKIKNLTVLKSICKENDIYSIYSEDKKKIPLEYVLDNSYDEIFITDGKGIVLYCNKAFEKNYGIKKEEILNKDVKLLETQGIVDRIAVHEVINSKNTLTFIQRTFQGKAILNTIKPILDEEGNVIYIIENCRDISEMTQLKEALDQRDLKIKEYQKKLKYFVAIDSKNFLDFKSTSMQTLNSSINKLAIRNINILLLGESGIGKTYMASYIHNISLRKENPFVTINCTTIPENLIESELFGYKKGSFTGALQDKEGLVEQAEGGTLFLDEIGELPYHMQGKLLQLIQERVYTPVGSVYPKKLDIRIIAASNKDLLELVKSGKFRNDLYFRLTLGVIKLPPLRERKEDIEHLINYYLDLFNKKYDMSIELTEETRKILLNYSWPGNIRELEHILEFLVVNAFKPDDKIEKNSLPINMFIDVNNQELNFLEDTEQQTLNGLSNLLEESKKKIILDTYKKYKSSYKVAEVLQISQSTAYRLIQKYKNF